MPQAKTGIEDRSRRRQLGTAAIEFGLFIPVLLILLTGTAELGLLMYEGMQVNNAVEAGALYAATNGFDSAAITTAVTNASVLPTGLNTLAATPAPSQFCGCPTATGITNAGPHVPR
jgi:Flp pilus assembly protein TadG